MPRCRTCYCGQSFIIFDESSHCFHLSHDVQPAQNTIDIRPQNIYEGHDELTSVSLLLPFIQLLDAFIVYDAN